MPGYAARISSALGLRAGVLLCSGRSQRMTIGGSDTRRPIATPDRSSPSAPSADERRRHEEARIPGCRDAASEVRVSGLHFGPDGEAANRQHQRDADDQQQRCDGDRAQRGITSRLVASPPGL